MSVKKSSTPKINRRTAAQIEVTGEDALMLFKAIHAPGISSTAQIDILGYVDEVLDDAPKSDPIDNKALFLKFFPAGWDEASLHTRRNVGDIIQRVRAGQSIEEIHEYFEQMRAKHHAENEEKERNQPEPEDKTSAEWRYWKLRRIERALRGELGTEAKSEAWQEFKQFARRGIRAMRDHRAAIEILPYLIIACQESEQKGGAS